MPDSWYWIILELYVWQSCVSYIPNTFLLMFFLGYYENSFKNNSSPCLAKVNEISDMYHLDTKYRDLHHVPAGLQAQRSTPCTSWTPSTELYTMYQVDSKYKDLHHVQAWLHGHFTLGCNMNKQAIMFLVKLQVQTVVIFTINKVVWRYIKLMA